ncbi:MAG: tetratricopeptide repeat protein [Halopseudomonas sp.]
MRLTISTVVIITSTLFSSSLFAYNFVVTENEFRKMTPYCQRSFANFSNAHKSGLQGKAPKHKGKDSIVAWHAGLWHFCGGVVKLNRAKSTSNPLEREKYLRSGISNISYSYGQIDKSHPWTRDMFKAYIMAYRMLGERDNAKKYLDLAIKYQPEYIGIYSLYAMFYFDTGDYKGAVKVLLEGNNIAEGKSAEIFYFLGLAMIEMREIEEAKKYEEKARSLGYPLEGLSLKIKRAEIKKKTP